jgi:DNA-binding NtrC family response regulator
MVSTLCTEARESGGETDSARTEKTASILIVEDDGIYRETLAKMFAQAGYAVTVAPTAQRALQQLEQQSVDLVLTDLKMPGKDGFDLVRGLRHRRPVPKVIIMTAYGTWDSYFEAKALGVSGFLLKPLARDYLLSVVRNVLGRLDG